MERSGGRVWVWPVLDAVGVVAALYLVAVSWKTGDWLQFGVASFLAVLCVARQLLELRRGAARKSAEPGAAADPAT